MSIHVRREHVEHYVKTLDDRELANQHTLLRMSDLMNWNTFCDLVRAQRCVRKEACSIPIGFGWRSQLLTIEITPKISWDVPPPTIMGTWTFGSPCLRALWEKGHMADRYSFVCRGRDKVHGIGKCQFTNCFASLPYQSRQEDRKLRRSPGFNLVQSEHSNCCTCAFAGNILWTCFKLAKIWKVEAIILSLTWLPRRALSRTTSA